MLTDRTRLTEGQDFGVLALRTWRLGDLGAKHALLWRGWAGATCRRTWSRTIWPPGGWCGFAPERPGILSARADPPHRHPARPGGGWLAERLAEGG